jgi:hypothetical protein
MWKVENPQNFNFTRQTNKTLFLTSLFFLQMKYLSYENDDDNIILIAKTVH